MDEMFFSVCSFRDFINNVDIKKMSKKNTHIYICTVEELVMSLHDTVILCSCSPELVFTQRFLQIVVLVKASGPPHVLVLWLGVTKGMLPVRYFSFNKASFCVCRIVILLWLGVTKGMLPVKYFSFNKASLCVCRIVIIIEHLLKLVSVYNN